MVKLPRTIYDEERNNAIAGGNYRYPAKLVLKAFIIAGYGEKKARKWIETLADLNGDKLDWGTFIIYSKR